MHVTSDLCQITADTLLVLVSLPTGSTDNDQNLAVCGLEATAYVAAPSPRQASLADTMISREVPLQPSGPVPRRIGRYVVIEKIGAGAMGAVYAAYDPELDRRIALKLLHPQQHDPLAGERLLREAQALAKVAHPNIVAVHDVGHHGGKVFMAMEFVRGQTLTSWLVEHRGAPLLRRLGMMIEVGRGLAAAHAQSLVHRDFKPDNVLVGEDGRPRVLDFGLVAYREAADREQPGAQPLDLTTTGAVMGTPAYMAPEQFSGLAADARTDQFEGQHRGFSEGRSRPRWLTKAIARGLSIAPEHRWPSMDELLRQLERGSPWRRARRVLTLAAVLTGAVGLGTTLTSSTEPNICPDKQAPLATIWNPEVKQQLEQALRASGTVYSGATTDHVVRQLAQYGVSWENMYQQSCSELAADSLNAARLARVACLEQRCREFAATIDVLRQPDTKTIEHATNAVALLVPPDTCLDPRRASAAAEVPDDPELAAEVIRLRGSMAEVQALWQASKLERALEVLDQTDQEIQALGDPYLKLQAGLTRGRILGKTKQYEATTKILDEVYYGAIASGRDLLALEARLALTRVNAARASSYDRVFSELKDADALIKRLGYDDPPGELRARHLLNLGFALERTRQTNLARGPLEQSYALLKSIYPAEHPLVTRAVGNLAILEMADKNFQKAVDYAQSVVAQKRMLVGADHPELAGALNNLAIVAREAQDLGTALAAQTEAVAIWERISLASIQPILAMGYRNLGSIYARQQNYPAARGAYTREIELRVQLGAAEHGPFIADAHVQIARLFIREDNHVAALEEIMKGLAAIPQPHMAADNIRFYAKLEGTRSQLDIHFGTLEGTATRLENLAARQRELEVQERYIASTLLRLADVHWAEGRKQHAYTIIAQARALLANDPAAKNMMSALAEWETEHPL